MSEKSVELLLHEISGIIASNNIGAICIVAPLNQYATIHSVTNLDDENVIKILESALRRHKRGRSHFTALHKTSQ
jgi:hypothetical protein